ncbi:MAG: Crp/Fnr family transcriptional regulator [Candidatus Tumulicola sp.]
MNDAPHAALLQNRVLSLFEPEVLATLVTAADVRRVEPDFTINEPGEPISIFCFPLSAVASTVTCMSNGDAIEAVTIGNEGLVGISAILGGETGTLRSFIQVPGEACLIGADTFLHVLRKCPQVYEFLLRYANVLINVISQSAACNRLHNVVQRCARWLLTTSDRARSRDFQLTQELLAEMVGSRRPTVSDAASTLQQAGLIRYKRGDVRIIDRAGLETASCECYHAISKAYQQLFTSASPPGVLL